MTLIRHELKQAWKALLIWTRSIGAFIVICLFMIIRGLLTPVLQTYIPISTVSSHARLPKSSWKANAASCSVPTTIWDSHPSSR